MGHKKSALEAIILRILEGKDETNLREIARVANLSAEVDKDRRFIQRKQS